MSPTAAEVARLPRRLRSLDWLLTAHRTGPFHSRANSYSSRSSTRTFAFAVCDGAPCTASAPDNCMSPEMRSVFPAE